MSPRVGVYVLNYNGRQFLDQCFASLERQTYRDFAAILLDNASDDDSVSYVAERFPHVQTIVYESNINFAPAYDRALRSSTHELCALLNNDAWVDEHWLEELVAAIDGGGPDAGACTSRIRFVANPDRLNHAGARVTLVGSGFDVGFGEGDAAPYDEPKETGAPSGAASLVRRAAYLDVGGFDPQYVAYFEDADLGWRLWLCGWRVLYVPGAIAYHHYGASWGGRASARRVYYCQRNRLANMTVNLSALVLAMALPMSAGYDVARGAMFLRAGNRPALAALARGTLDFVRHLPHHVRRRHEVQRRRQRSDWELMRRGVIATPIESVRAFIAAQRASRSLTA